ncbi:recombination hotspot-binding protein-like protein [Corynespora cassiicola Philippines]|uniref:Recombination hotspot-binding protein-like protein n=1 Tax=Corynespora cassiicola Philippines TaxID=1448308 RepID=A0A2T2NLK4_CORCC|nr:recombination hotspot-binding protein-like protein [Corynespora cassiicola Philippines]
MAGQSGMVDPAIFQDLQARVDEDSAVRDELRDIVQALEKQNRNISFILSRAHSTPVTSRTKEIFLSAKTQALTSTTVPDVLKAAEEPIQKAVETVSQLSQSASKLPYYKFNNMWSRQVQDLAYGVLFWGWLGGHKLDGGAAKCGELLTIEKIGELLKIPVNLKDRDEFHLTIEEYLQALISLLEELTRLARNAVTLGDYERPLLINQFVKDVFAGFQVLNLKNDSLRRRSDGIKYRVKDVEDVVYDLSLRNLIPQKEQ